MWKNVLDSEDVIVCERYTDELNVRIEARKISEVAAKTNDSIDVLGDPDNWRIYIKYFTTGTQNINFTEEYSCKNIDDTKEMMACLKVSDLKTLKEIIQLKLSQTKDININLKRTSRDYNNEAWMFTINNESLKNKMFIKESDVIEVEIILYEKYKINEEKIIHKLVEMLGLSNNDVRTKIIIYYCKTKTKYFVEEGYLENMRRV
ncbi:MAG: hypothetical protein ABIG89_07360 [Candidatus Woesearchaeota archaeon]